MPIKPNNISLSIRSLLMLFHAFIFIIIYTSTNWYAEYMKVTETNITHFDQALPFIEWMIVPYLSSIIYFLLAFFCIHDSKKYRQLNQNMLFAVLVSGWCFYFYPLYFGAVELNINSPWKLGFDWVYLFDKPYNQAPSLHIVYGVILLSSLLGCFNRLISCAIIIGITLMLLSTVFTYQHRITDLLSGVIVACGILSFTRYYLLSYIAQVYLSFSLISLLLSVILIDINMFFSLLFTYLSIGCAVIFIAYSTNHPYLLGKRNNGTFRIVNLIVLFPYIFIYWIIWKNRSINDEKPVMPVLPWLSVGRRLSRADTAGNFTHIIDLSAELPLMSVVHDNHDNEYHQKEARYLYLPLLDLQPIMLAQAIVFCEYVESIKKQCKNPHIYVHCTMGISRSYAMIASYLVWSAELAPCDVKSYLYGLKGQVILRENYLKHSILNQLSEHQLSEHETAQIQS